MNQVAQITQPAAQLPLPSRVGQGTAVEQSRAIAQVQAAIVVAQQCPRDVPATVEQMRQSCQQMGLAKRAFFRYSRGGSNVSGPSVHLARELARCWGNFEYGLVELRRDDDEGQSEMLAFAQDLQTNTRNSTTFIVPHKRDVKTGPKSLVDMRDIYENNANHGARRVREMILAVLPPWYVEDGKTLCNQTLEHGGGEPLPTRIANCIERFGLIGVADDQLEQKMERPSKDWNAHDLAQLGIMYDSINAGEVRKDDEFPPVRVTAAEVLGQTKPPAKDEPKTAPAKPEKPVQAQIVDQPADDKNPFHYAADEIREGS